MRPFRFGLCSATLAVAFAAAPAPATTQDLPLAPVRAAGQTVTPVFEGWYDNPDGTRTLSFGYFNRNTEAVVEVPLGEHNRIEPAELDGGQPAVFHPRRHWGVFGVVVPADFDGRVEWTLVNQGETFSIPANLAPEWKIDALAGEAGAGNTPPVLHFGSEGHQGAGPGGVYGEALSGEVGQAITVTVWAKDDGLGGAGLAAVLAGPRENGPPPVSLTWFKHQGPGEVTFSEEEGEIPVEGGHMSTTATFSQPGEYILRVRANDASGVSSAGHAQCCWTNGFVKVNVTR